MKEKVNKNTEAAILEAAEGLFIGVFYSPNRQNCEDFRKNSK